MKKGFTLVELLVVVAIVGVLSVIGVPTYRKMVQKARQSEAKTSLGTIYSNQMLFMNEYDSYGSNLRAIGFDREGYYSPMTLNWIIEGSYSVGFPRDGSVCSPGVLAPELIYPAGVELSNRLPSYYDPTSSVTLYLREGADGLSYCEYGWVGPDGKSFFSTASGVIAPGIPVNSTKSAEVDQWTINEKRELKHRVDGTR